LIVKKIKPRQMKKKIVKPTIAQIEVIPTLLMDIISAVIEKSNVRI